MVSWREVVGSLVMCTSPSTGVAFPGVMAYSLVSHFVKATTTAPMMTTSTKMTIGSRRMRARGAEMSSCPLMNLRYRHPPKSGSSERDFARTRTMIRS